jgi:putative redox protein
MSDKAIRLRWTGGESFDAVSPKGAAITLDGESEKGFSPTQALLASTASCMGIDVALILKKMREELLSLEVEIEGDRMEEPPRYFHAIEIRFRIGGSVSRERAERAVQLSLDRYCSVFHTLRKDLEVHTTLEMSDSRA